MCNFGQIRFVQNLIGVINEFVCLYEMLWDSKGIWDKPRTVSKVLLFVGLQSLLLIVMILHEFYAYATVIIF